MTSGDASSRSSPETPSSASDTPPRPSASVQYTIEPTNRTGSQSAERRPMTPILPTVAAGGEALLVDEHRLLALADHLFVDDHFLDRRVGRRDVEHDVHHRLLEDGAQAASARAVLLRL